MIPSTKLLLTMMLVGGHGCLILIMVSQKDATALVLRKSAPSLVYTVGESTFHNGGKDMDGTICGV